MKELVQILRKNGLRATKERLRLLEILKSSKKPLSILDVLALDKKQTMDQATVYRSLASFQNAGLVKQISFNQDAYLYELRDHGDHHHLVCTGCGLVEDFHGCNFRILSKKALARSKNFIAVKDHSFELFGLCKTCAN